MTTYCLKLPPAVYSGEGAFGKIPEILAANHVSKAAVFTDQGIEKLPFYQLFEEQLEKAGITWDVFDEFPAEPTYMQAQQIIDSFRSSKADIIIALGGGSVLDTAKLASMCDTDDYTVKDLLDNPSRAVKTRKMIAIPTTAGTGAEATPNAIVGVPEKETKIGIVNDNSISDYVILDPETVRNLPRKIAASTGLDTLCHAIECYTGKKANPLSDTFALAALDVVMNELERACDDPDDIEAKIDMQRAAFYGGIAITASGTNGVHGLSYPLGGKYHIAHGVSNAMLLVPVMKFNEPEIRPYLAKVYDAVYHGEDLLKEEADKSAYMIEWMDRMVKHLDIPTSLAEFNVPKEDLEGLVKAGMDQQRLLSNNRREITADDARNIYLEVL